MTTVTDQHYNIEESRVDNFTDLATNCLEVTMTS